MSSTRNRNNKCRSLDNSSRTTSSNTIYFNRWSEVVPPKTALTFAALWDPEEGMVTFSGASLFESESLSAVPTHPDMYDDDEDDPTQVITIDRENSATPTLAAFQDAFKAFLHRTPRHSEENLQTKVGQQSASRCLHSRASSTFDGLDIYSHDIQLKPKRSLQLSCMDLLDMELGGLRLGSDSIIDMYRSDSESSNSSAGSRPANLKSRFSTTTTSTSNYVDVTSSALHSLRVCETSPTRERIRPGECISPADSWPYLPRRRGVLRKRRPLDGDAPASPHSMPSTPRKGVPRPWMSSSPSSPSSSSFATTFSSRAASVSTWGEDRRGRFPRPFGGFSSTLTTMTGQMSTETPAPTPPNTPSKGPRLRLPFTFRLKRKSGQASSEDGWVCIDAEPVIRERYVANIDEDC